MYIQKTST